VASDFILTLRCPERQGIVHAITSFLIERNCDITEHQQFDDIHHGQLFLRTCFRTQSPNASLTELQASFTQVAAQFGMDWQLHDASRRDRLLVMVSKSGHCLNDLLYRWQTQTLGAEIAAVVSNHQDLQPMARSAGLPFIHIPLTAQTKPAAEDRLREVIEEFSADTVILARYMQILSDQLSKDLERRAINIHHSFLPSFMGGHPYHQAYERGVKLVGATAHYVTADLDEGPIIEQVVAEVDHRQAPEDLIRVGRDSECRALARAVTWHSEHRILLDGHRTVVFK
jgi:formyltetrahydrofolate deformylase